MEKRSQRHGKAPKLLSAYQGRCNIVGTETFMEGDERCQVVLRIEHVLLESSFPQVVDRFQTLMWHTFLSPLQEL